MILTQVSEFVWTKAYGEELCVRALVKSKKWLELAWCDSPSLCIQVCSAADTLSGVSNPRVAVSPI